MKRKYQTCLNNGAVYSCMFLTYMYHIKINTFVLKSLVLKYCYKLL